MSNIVDKAFDIIKAMFGETPVVDFRLRLCGDRGVVSVPVGTSVPVSIGVDSVQVGEKWISIFFSI